MLLHPRIPAEKTGKAVGDAIQWVTDHMEESKTWAEWIGIGVAAFVALTAVVKTVVLVARARKLLSLEAGGQSGGQ